MASRPSANRRRAPSLAQTSAALHRGRHAVGQAAAVDFQFDDDQTLLSEYLYCLVLHNEPSADPLARAVLLMVLRDAHLDCKVISSRDEDEFFVLIKGGRPLKDGTDFYSYWAEIVRPLYELRVKSPEVSWEDWRRRWAGAGWPDV